MTTNSEIISETTLKERFPFVPWMQTGFYAVSIIFNLCLIAQLLTVGIAVFYDPAWWHIHGLFVKGYSGLSLLLLGWVFFTAFPRKIQRLTLGLPILLAFQFATIHFTTPLHLEILHPLIGFLLVYTSSSLVHNIGHSLTNKM